MRGKGFHAPGKVPLAGITPAYAGKSQGDGGGDKVKQDHPRVCGEKVKAYVKIAHFMGSPPRMRGKAVDAGHAQGAVRITPAYAGKSRAISASKRAIKDHPRVCGEKHPCRICRKARLGSPPRMRGKVATSSKIFYKFRITPAYAGKSNLLQLLGVVS